MEELSGDIGAKKPLSDIFKYREYLFKRYCDILDCDKNMIHSLRDDFRKYLVMRVECMPYWMVMELDRLGFNIDEEEELQDGDW